MKKYRYILTFSFSIILCISYAFGQNGQLNWDLLDSFRNDFSGKPENKVLMNAVSSNDIKQLAINRENLGQVDKHFSHRVKSAGITDQKSTGRCWLFTGLNVLRAEVIEQKSLDNFSFSQSFNFFYDQLEKSNLFLEGIIATADKPIDDKKVEWLFKNPIGDGGQWTGVVDIISKYGVVPSDIFPESYNSENTRLVSQFIRRKLKEDGLTLRNMYKDGKKENELRKTKEIMLGDIYKILAISLGEPPKEFTWRYKNKDGNLSALTTYTPKSFYEQFVGIHLEDYIMFMNDPTREFGKLYEIEFDRHTYEGGNWKYINLENDKIKTFAIASIIDNNAMYFSCDVGKQLDKDRGFLDVNNYDYGALFGMDFTMDKKQRIQTFESGSTHGMALVGVDMVDSKPVKWLLENSWGDSGFDGHLIMTDEWFDEYMFRLVIHKKYVDEETLKILSKDAIMLPPWDPMFLPDN
ncbi:MAG: C1 family peptidase [Bacteroidales bacterium]